MATWYIYCRRPRLDSDAIDAAWICRNPNKDLEPNNNPPHVMVKNCIVQANLREVKKLAFAMAPRVYFGNQEVRK